MSDPKLPLLGRLAVHNKLLRTDQVVECLIEQRRDSRPRNLGEILVEKGYLSKGQLEGLVAEQQRLIERHRAKKAADAPPPPDPPAAAEPPAAAAATPPPAPAAPKSATSEAAAAPAAAAPRGRSAPAVDRGPLEELLRAAAECGASDVHLHSGSRVRHRIAGSLVEVGDEVLAAERAEQLLCAALGADERARLDATGQVDLAFGIEGLGRFRANVYRQQRGLDGVFRRISEQPPSLAELGLPETLERFTQHHQGMVLLTGPSGSGKTSTMAALVDLVNASRDDHILSIEDPIEYVHTSKRCLVNQRSVGPHTGSFARALRAALREDPDVIVIGELRDLETISLALTAAETGHFVLATLHTGGVIQTINRLVGAFPANQQGQVRTMISESLRAVVSQRLLARADGQGRVPALETLVVTKAVGNLIRESKTFQIQSILQTGSAQGMSTLDQSVKALLAEGVIAPEEARRHVDDPKGLAA